jgi:hypothetical protein
VAAIDLRVRIELGAKQNGRPDAAGVDLMRRTNRGLAHLAQSGCALAGRAGRNWRFARAILFALFAIGVGARCVVADGEIVLAEGGVLIQTGSGAAQGPPVGVFNLNDILNADRFYDAGFTGTQAVMANIEAGYAWAGHETLNHVNLIPTEGGAAGEVDRHATLVAMVMGGRTGGANPGPYQQGLAPDAQLYSGAIALGWSPNPSPLPPRYTTSFSLSLGISTFGPYAAAFDTGIAGPNGDRPADVVNVSWLGSSNSTGVAATDTFGGTFDAMANENPRTLLVVAAGNSLPSGAGPNRVPSPASGYNNLTVGALAPNGGAFNVASVFSNGGPNDYADPVNGTVSAVRQVIDIAVPGESFASAYYGGETGGNRTSLGGSPSGPPGGPDWYLRGVSGTSLSAPAASGGAALLYDAAYSLLAASPDARDGRVMKAVLKNSATKTLGWDNGQVAHPNGNGGVVTTKGLDDRVGAGRMNLDQAFDQLLSGTTDVAGLAAGLVGTVDEIGWDFGLVVDGVTNDYLFDLPLVGGSMFTATLDWFRDRDLIGIASYVDSSYDNLDLELWRAAGGLPTVLVSESKSTYNNSEHFSFAIPTTGEYMLRVRWAGELFDTGQNAANELYGLAWAGVAVPEPSTIVLLAFAGVPFLMAGRGRRRA